MKDYYTLFVELSLQQCTKSDYTNKLKVKKHNAAFRKLRQLQDEMRLHNYDELLPKLLYHEDDRVRINAAALCLQHKVFVEQAVLTLKNVVATSTDSTLCFSAEMLLRHTD